MPKNKSLQFALGGSKDLNGDWRTNITADFEGKTINDWNINVKRLETDRENHLHIEAEVVGEYIR